jgi:hypothetical protein
VPPYGPSEETCSKAYDLWCQNYSFRHIWLMLSGPPHHCKSKTSAIAWVKRGRDLETLRGTSLGRRRALRERHAVELRRQYQQIEEEMDAGLLKRVEGRKLQLQIMAQLERLLGLPVAPAPRKVKISGDGTVSGLDPDLAEALSALSPEELLPHYKKNGAPHEHDRPD